MIDEELKTYIHNLLKQDYDIDTVKETLIKAGHDIKKVEQLTAIVFELFHKDLLEYIESELKKGKSIDIIKDDLLSLGHSETKLKQVMTYHKKSKPFFKGLHLHETIHREKVWFKSWLMIYLYLFIIVIIIFLGISLLVISTDSVQRPKTFNARWSVCTEINETEGLNIDLYTTLCLALVSSNSKACFEIDDNNRKEQCIDAYSIYTFYKTGSYSVCNNIKDFSLNELCSQIHDKSCNNFLGHEGYCDSVVSDSLAYCSSKIQSTSSIIGNCFDNYHFYQALNNNPKSCDEINNIPLNKLCLAIS